MFCLSSSLKNWIFVDWPKLVNVIAWYFYILDGYTVLS